ncbi:exported hypothetical protein [uncultured Gammaproteobacteria bacterium]
MTRVSVVKFFRRTMAAVLLVLAGASGVLGQTGGQAGAGDQPWYRQPFDANLTACSGSSFKSGCADWINALESIRPRDVASGQPEWRRLTVGRVFDLCDSRLPPDWCGQWQAAMRAASAQTAYLETAARAEVQAAEIRGRWQSQEMAWKRMVYRASINQITKEELVMMKRMGLDGNVDALELLAWIYTEGRRGIPQNFAQAYELYGFAVLAGRDSLKKNLEALWGKLNEIERRRLTELFRTVQ